MADGDKLSSISRSRSLTEMADYWQYRESHFEAVFMGGFCQRHWFSWLGLKRFQTKKALFSKTIPLNPIELNQCRVNENPHFINSKASLAVLPKFRPFANLREVGNGFREALGFQVLFFNLKSKI